jgi:hypothetical protein
MDDQPVWTFSVRCKDHRFAGLPRELGGLQVQDDDDQAVEQLVLGDELLQAGHHLLRLAIADVHLGLVQLLRVLKLLHLGHPTDLHDDRPRVMGYGERSTAIATHFQVRLCEQV